MCLFWRFRLPGRLSLHLATSSPTWRSPILGKLEIGTRQLNYRRLHVPPDFFPNCQPGALSTRLHCNRMPRHHTRPPGRYNFLPKILLSNPRILRHLLLGLKPQLNRLVKSVLNVWDMVTLLLIALLNEVCTCMKAL